MNIEPENRYKEDLEHWSPEDDPELNVIREGNLEFRDLKVKYRKDLPDVIRGVTCSIKAGEKIGVVGRTGAGKTTLINTLLGVTQISAGNILIDGADIEAYPLKALRQSITMIDQDPTLINASFR
jgi:ABC-type multidrug transport system fused ATPase/permease subunit